MVATKQEIKSFIKTWSTDGHEVADKVTFWNTFLRLLGVDQSKIDDKSFIEYEKPIKLKANESFHGSIDAYIPQTHVLIEQKSSGVDLEKPEKRDNGGHTEKITPFGQARRYDNHLSANERAYYYVLCNFNEFYIYDVRESLDVKPIVIELKDLEKELHQFDFMIQTTEQKRLIKERQVSVAAGDLVSKIYKELVNIFKSYGEPDDDKVKHSINSLCVRLVFCLYAEDADLFYKKDAFYDYLVNVPANQIGLKLKELFKVLNTKLEDRNKVDHFWSVEHPVLSKFPYVNGGLFADEDVIIPPFTDQLKDIVLNEASKGFDWSAISPTIFGAVFESTLNPTTRRQGGMHYTSVENIHKVIDPLFLDDLKHELQTIKSETFSEYQDKVNALKNFQTKISQLTFFDPACGSGNFLTETYLSLRRLENEVIKYLNPSPTLDVGQAKDYIKVSIQQFYGIEINDFAVSVAKTAMWIAECQMFEETKDLIYAQGNFLPLKTYVNIHEGNALTTNWNNVIDKNNLNYIIGNPPFNGYSGQSKEQKTDIKTLYSNKKGKALRNSGKIDFVSGWFYKASQYIYQTDVRVAFVSTSSITQGDQEAPVWEPLYKQFDIHIDFAYRPFDWKSEAHSQAQVVVVIIGFSYAQNNKEKLIFDANKTIKAKNINPYLKDLPNAFIYSAEKPICNVPTIITGSRPADGGNLLLSEKQYKEVMQKYPSLKPYLRQYAGANEFLNNKIRYCLWLNNCSPHELKHNPFLQERLRLTKESRLKSSKKATQRYAQTPWLFQEDRQPHSDYLFIPRTTSNNRQYIPMDYISPDIIISDSAIYAPNASLYMFGILESQAHMNWMRVVTGRLGNGYRYSVKIVYNSFPWPTPTLEQKQKIEQTAQAILDVRKNYPDSSLADLYDPLTMPSNLLKAHKENDKAVLDAYGLPSSATESEIVTHLFKMYEKLTKKNTEK